MVVVRWFEDNKVARLSMRLYATPLAMDQSLLTGSGRDEKSTL